MQVTQGLPRLIEIFNARKIPSTPTMEIHLSKDKNNEKDAKIIAEKIKETKLSEIISGIELNFTDKKIEVDVANQGLRDAHMTINTVSKKLEEKGYKNDVKGSNIVIDAGELDFKGIYKLKEKIKTVVVSGVSGITQVLVVKREANYVVLVSGSNLKEILKIDGVNPDKTLSNNPNEVAEVLGVEAARNVIIREVNAVLQSQGIDVDKRHLELIADTMCAAGKVKGVTRMGIIADKSSILARASFETPIKQFVDATLKGTKDKLSSVVENIILNQPVPLGTGLPGLLVKVTGSLNPDSKTSESKKLVKSSPKKKKVVKKEN